MCLFLVPLLYLTGCISHMALKKDQVEYARDFASASDKELLLNLARLANDDPVYFMQLGSISSGYSWANALGFTPQSVNNSPGYFQSSTTAGGTPPTGSDASSVMEFTKHALTLGGSATSTFTQNPVFTFVPLTGSNFVEILLNPISEKVFMTFYDQGYRADLLARTMISSVKIEIDQTGDAEADLANAHANNDKAHANAAIAQLNAANAQIILHDFADNAQVNAATAQAIAQSIAANEQAITAYDQERAIANEAANAQTNAMNAQTNAASAQINAANAQANATVAESNAKVIGQDNVQEFAKALGQANAQVNAANAQVKQLDKNAHKGYRILVNNPNDASYGDFLDYCSSLYYAQISHRLMVATNADTSAPVIIYSDKSTKLTDVVAAVTQSNLSIAATPYNSSQSIVTVQQRKPSGLQLTKTEPNNRTVDSSIQVKSEDDVVDRMNFVADNLESTDFSFRAKKLADTYGNHEISVNFRTFEAAMYSVAKEEYYYRQRKKKGSGEEAAQVAKTERTRVQKAAEDRIAIEQIGADNIAKEKRALAEANARLPVCTIKFDCDTNGPFAIVVHGDNTLFKVRPLMRLTCKESDEKRPCHILTDITYGDGKDESYFVGDPDHETQNRSIFTILSYLFVQSAVSTQNLPVQSTLRLQ